MTTWTATIEKTKSAQPMGQYQPTALDARKAAADVLITAADGNGYSIRSNLALSGRGIKAYGNGNFSVTDTALSKLRTQFAVECDF